MSKRQNGFGPALGESLQSFIFRVLYRTGYSDFSTILTRGGWGDKPCVPYQAKNEFKTFDPDILFKLYEKNTLGSQSCFSSPFPSKHFFIDTFYPVKQKSYSGQHVQVRYCQKCIDKQLYELGYAYFKAEWLTFSNCPVHNKRLSVVEHRLSLNETSEAVKNILIGKGAEIGNLISMRRAADDTPPLFRVDLYFLPCAKDAIFDYIFFNEELCPDDYIDLMFTGLLKKENSNHPAWGAK